MLGQGLRASDARNALVESSGVCFDVYEFELYMLPCAPQPYTPAKDRKNSETFGAAGTSSSLAGSQGHQKQHRNSINVQDSSRVGNECMGYILTVINNHKGPPQRTHSFIPD